MSNRLQKSTSSFRPYPLTILINPPLIKVVRTFFQNFPTGPIALHFTIPTIVIPNNSPVGASQKLNSPPSPLVAYLPITLRWSWAYGISMCTNTAIIPIFQDPLIYPAELGTNATDRSPHSHCCSTRPAPSGHVRMDTALETEKCWDWVAMKL